MGVSSLKIRINFFLPLTVAPESETGVGNLGVEEEDCKVVGGLGKEREKVEMKREWVTKSEIKRT